MEENKACCNFEITVRKKLDSLIFYFIGLWLLFWVATIVVLGIMCYGLIKVHGVYDLLGAWFFFFLAGIYFLNIFLWQIFGKEILIIDKDYLVIRKKGPLISIPKRIERDKIVNIDFDADEELPRWIKMWGLSGGKVIVEYVEGSVRFGQSLSQVEAKQLCEKLKSYFPLTC